MDFVKKNSKLLINTGSGFQVEFPAKLGNQSVVFFFPFSFIETKWEYVRVNLFTRKISRKSLQIQKKFSFARNPSSETTVRDFKYLFLQL